jgi:hypothetical protein
MCKVTLRHLRMMGRQLRLGALNCLRSFLVMNGRRFVMSRGFNMQIGRLGLI